MRIHTEFHRLVTELEDAISAITFLVAIDPTPDEYLDAYADVAQRRKELYAWIAANTKRPSSLYTVYLKF